jgi:hypothetical protein
MVRVVVNSGTDDLCKEEGTHTNHDVDDMFGGIGKSYAPANASTSCRQQSTYLICGKRSLEFKVVSDLQHLHFSDIFVIKCTGLNLCHFTMYTGLTIYFFCH